MIKHYLTKSLNSGENFDGSVKHYYGLLLMKNIALTGWILLNGGSPSANSIQVIPRDHISYIIKLPVSRLYLLLDITYGDIQNGVPITDYLYANVFIN